jgi:hypothetical protein
MEQLVSRAQVSPATTTHFVHDRMGNVIAETAGGGATGTTGTTREYIYFYEAEISPTTVSRTVVDRPLAVVNAVNTATPATYWVSVDHLNRPVKMTTATKASVWDAIWQPWGGVHSLIVTGTAVFDARFPRPMVPNRNRLALQLAPELRSNARPLHPTRSTGLRRWAERVCVCEGTASSSC